MILLLVVGVVLAAILIHRFVLSPRQSGESDERRDVQPGPPMVEPRPPFEPPEPGWVPGDGEHTEKSADETGFRDVEESEDDTSPPVGVRTPGFLRPRAEADSSQAPSERPDGDDSSDAPADPSPDGSAAGEALGELVQIASDVARGRDGDVELAGVMAKLIESADPATVERLVEAPEVHLAEVVGELLRTADPQTRRELEQLLEQPERKDVAELLQLVERDYGVKGGELPEDVREEIERRDIRKDLEITSRPGQIGWFASLDPLERRRIIVRVLCGLVAREDVPTRPLRRPRKPASPAEERRWPLSRARWPIPAPVRLPKPGVEELPRRATKPSRKAS
ncbi:MAG: hypothetical protein KatS3mg008_0498 [Acidimicrobiales bacterium]|nr:MAG: hypothetical protein KatS3mg008_0498 [Acidimicrobiales bacterium]